MVIDRIRIEERAGDCRVVAQVRRESAGADDELWFQFPKELAPQLVAEPDAFFAAGLLPAMATGERLRLEGGIAPRLLRNNANIQDMYAAWAGKARRVPVEAPPRPPHPEIPGRGTGVFFSGGVDSFYTLLKNLDAITHLMLIDRLDSKQMKSAKVCQDTREHAAEVAGALGKKLIVIETNARDLYVPHTVNWKDYHGAVLAAIGLMLRQVMGTVLIAATHSLHDLRPWGSHPLLDPLWSTEATEIIYDGVEARRDQKIINYICKSEVALRSLRVCLSPGDQYNCGKCEKCLRTMIPLYVAGCLEKSSAFPHELPLKEAAEHSYITDGLITFARENIALLVAKPDQTVLDRRLIRAMEHAIKRSRRKIARRERKKLRRIRTWRDWLREITNT